MKHNDIDVFALTEEPQIFVRIRRVVAVIRQHLRQFKVKERSPMVFCVQLKAPRFLFVCLFSTLVTDVSPVYLSSDSMKSRAFSRCVIA